MLPPELKLHGPDEVPDAAAQSHETGAPDGTFKRWLNTALLAAACGLLCLEWIVRRLARLA